MTTKARSARRNGPRGIARIDWVRIVTGPSAVRLYSSRKRTGVVGKELTV